MKDMVPGHSRTLWTSFHWSLRVKIALGVALPIFLILSTLSLMHYERGRYILDVQIDAAASQLGHIVMGSLRHAIRMNDAELRNQILNDVAGLESMRRVQIVNLEGEVKVDSRRRDLNTTHSLDDAGCVECHRLPVGQRPNTMRLSGAGGLLRIATPIDNGPECTGCHAPDLAHLGVLLVDMSVADLEQRLVDDLRVDMLFSAGTAVLATLGIYVFIHRLVVRRVGALRRPLAEFAGGNFSARAPAPLESADEIDDVTVAFNHMAERLQQHAREEQERGEVRQRAIVEERERIARELHDGMAQLLGYVKTKAMAIRLLLSNRQTDAADQQLRQLEEAAHELFIDVREAILGLKAGHNDTGFAASLREYADKYNRLTGIAVEVTIDPEAEATRLQAETEVQLLRIAQEALTNIRKHASASSATLSLQRDDGTLEMTVRDNGVGFAPNAPRGSGRSHFGLSTMCERAEAIGAEFILDSNPGAGTRIIVRLKVDNDE